jgi:hypothetical protein
LVELQLLYNKTVARRDGSIRSWFITSSGNDLMIVPWLSHRKYLLQNYV